MLRTKTTLGGTGSINADNRGTEPALRWRCACSGRAVGLRKIGSPPLEKKWRGHEKTTCKKVGSPSQAPNLSGAGHIKAGRVFAATLLEPGLDWPSTAACCIGLAIATPPQPDLPRALPRPHTTLVRRRRSAVDSAPTRRPSGLRQADHNTAS